METRKERDSGGSVDAEIRRARAGDQQAIDAVCRHFRPGLEAFLRQNMSQRAQRWTEPQDIAQDVLVEMVRQLETLPADATEEDVVKRIRRTARFRALDAARNRRRDRGESALPGSRPNPTADRPSMGTVTAEDHRRWLSELVARLPDRYAEVVRLCAFEGLSYVEAARQLDLRADTVRKRYEAARQALDRKLSGRTDV